MSETFEDLHTAIKHRFPNANFVVSCFDNIAEIETKVLCNDEEIIVVDWYYTTNNYDNVVFKTEARCKINRRDDEKHIYYKDVVDFLININYDTNSDRNFLESIHKLDAFDKKKYDTNMHVYSINWGS